MQRVVVHHPPSLWLRLLYAAQAVRELLAARAVLASRSAGAVLAELQATGLPAAGRSDHEATEAICLDLDLIIWSLPAAAARVPWRSDCLVQALAARRWLNRLGYTSHAAIGVRKRGFDGLAAHAWVICDGRVIAGGDVSNFTPLVTHAVRGASEAAT